MKCTVRQIIPLGNLQNKLQDELKRTREKADKVAQNMIAKQVRETSKKTKAAEKAAGKSARGKGKVKTSQTEKMEVDEEGTDKPSFEDELLRAKNIETEAANKQEKLDQLLSQHMAEFQLPTEVPLTVMASSEQKASESARALLMAQALAQAAAIRSKADSMKAAENSKTDGGSNVGIGMQAAIAALEKNGSLQPAKNKKEKDDKSMAQSEMLKFGRHLLK